MRLGKFSVVCGFAKIAITLFLILIRVCHF